MAVYGSCISTSNASRLRKRPDGLLLGEGVTRSWCAAKSPHIDMKIRNNRFWISAGISKPSDYARDGDVQQETAPPRSPT